MTADTFHPAAPAVLLDLDGTLVDPAGAITGGISQALAQHALPIPPDAALRSMVGPPLVRSLSGIAGVPADRLAAVIATYRDRYRAEGMAASRVYPGVAGLLARLREHGYRLAVATQKPVGLATELLAATGLLEAVDLVHGSSDDEQDPAPLTKTQIVAAALADLGLPGGDTGARRAVMVGDRRHDMVGAAENGLAGIGVGWGFGGDRELLDAGATLVAETADELEAAIVRLLPPPAVRLAPDDAVLSAGSTGATA
ncbi:phosphatase [Tersicoccus solisilvae]|uniref:Phosphatase n=1 Tax=Tersicoccus solisilvae TaxID=1882339 RepID=A0ABQ1P0F5_9MICC|nr:HAD hydrolase-like protein [Tersicoccus solisilvae]GGC88618.1 phosphatase [Tersicoccus solisilvae]